MEKIAKVTFYGGTGSVTGANFLLEIDGKRILIDCGLTQGENLEDSINWDPFPYDPKEIDILFVTHAHVDHLGRIPKLINEGFRGEIYSTEPTKALAGPMFEDTAGILGRNEDLGLDKIYSAENIKLAVSLWQGFSYHQTIRITENLETTFLNAGHILGSAMVEFLYQGKKILFTGDLGNSPSMLLPDTEKVVDADYLIMESVYGDRNHEPPEETEGKVENAIEDTISRGGVLMIPSFAMERTQQLLYHINDLVEHKRIPAAPPPRCTGP